MAMKHRHIRERVYTSMRIKLNANDEEINNLKDEMYRAAVQR